MTSDLGIIQQLPGRPDLAERDQDAARAVASGLRDAKAATTRRVYGSAWQQFITWAEAGGHAALPATPQSVALYLGHLAASGRSIAAIQLARSAISHFHAAAGMQKDNNPARHPVVAEAVRGWRNRAPAPRQADALTADALARVREALRLPRRGRGGRMESAETAQRRAALDLAIIGILADGGLRPSEAADLTWGDVELWADGTGPSHGPEGQEPGRTANGGGDRGHRPGPEGDPARGRRPRSSGVRADRRGPSQPGTCRRPSSRPGRRVQWTQRPHRHGPADGGCWSAQRGGAAPRPVEARRHGGPVHAGRGRRRGAEVAELTYTTPNRGKHQIL